MVELAKPTVLDKRYVREGIMAFNYDAILAEREAWQKEIDKRELWVNKIRTGEYVSKGVLMELAKHHDKQEAEWQAALDGEHRRADAAVSALDTAEKERQQWHAVAEEHIKRADKAETKYAASSTAADELLDNWKHRADKAEARVKELEEGVHEIAEEVLGCSAPCSLDVRAKCKELEARLKRA